MSSSLRDRVITPPRYHLDDQTIATITGIARRSRPYEACGILCPPCLEHSPLCDRVMELPNNALQALAIGPDQAYAMESKDIDARLEEWMEEHEWTWKGWDLTEPANPTCPLADSTTTSSPTPSSTRLFSHFSIWHTHPQGHIGPSHGDLLNTIPGFSYLVASLHAHPGGSSVNFTWF